MTRSDFAYPPKRALPLWCSLLGLGALLLFFPVLLLGAAVGGAAIGVAAYFALKAAELLGWLSCLLARASSACRSFYIRHIEEDAR